MGRDSFRDDVAMTHRRIGGGAWATRWAGAPEVTVTAVEDHPTTVTLTYPVAPAPAGAQGARVRVELREVLAFRFGDFDLVHDVSDPAETAFDLIQIEGSGWLERVLTEGPHSWRPVGDRLGGVLAEDRPQHHRVTFDDHGTYDVLCVGIDITPLEPPPPRADQRQ